MLGVTGHKILEPLHVGVDLGAGDVGHDLLNNPSGSRSRGTSAGGPSGATLSGRKKIRATSNPILENDSKSRTVFSSDALLVIVCGRLHTQNSASAWVTPVNFIKAATACFLSRFAVADLRITLNRGGINF